MEAEVCAGSSDSGDPCTSDARNDLTASLQDFVSKSGDFETEEGMKSRMAVITYLEDTFRKWVASHPQYTQNEAGARVIPFGGHCLGVVMKESDIDVVCILPSGLTREQFFTGFTEALKGLVDRVHDLEVITAARVPILRLRLDEYELDLCVSVLADHSSAGTDILDDETLHGMSTECIRSLNGIRESRSILQLVPDEDNFRQTLKAVKMWAKGCGVYSSALGYLGGISWAILVARVCQQHPSAPQALLLLHFFTMLHSWPWPKPVMLKPLSQADPLKLDPFDLKRSSDFYNIMPILTPSYPEKNAAFTVTKSGFKIIQHAIQSGLEVCQSVFQRDALWEILFKKRDLLSLHRHFILVIAQADTVDDFSPWKGLIESKLRLLVESLEKDENIELIYIHPDQYTLRDVDLCVTWVLGLQLPPAESLNLNLTQSIAHFTALVTKAANDRGIYQAGMKINCRHVKRKELKKLLYG